MARAEKYSRASPPWSRCSCGGAHGKSVTRSCGSNPSSSAVLVSRILASQTTFHVSSLVRSQSETLITPAKFACECSCRCVASLHVTVLSTWRYIPGALGSTSCPRNTSPSSPGSVGCRTRSSCSCPRRRYVSFSTSALRRSPSVDPTSHVPTVGSVAPGGQPRSNGGLGGFIGGTGSMGSTRRQSLRSRSPYGSQDLSGADDTHGYPSSTICTISTRSTTLPSRRR